TRSPACACACSSASPADGGRPARAIANQRFPASAACEQAKCVCGQKLRQVPRLYLGFRPWIGARPWNAASRQPFLAQSDSVPSGVKTMNVQDIMTPAVDLVNPGMSIRDAASHMRDGDVGALPVGENDRLVGMVTDRDIAVRGFAGDKAPDRCT